MRLRQSGAEVSREVAVITPEELANLRKRADRASELEGIAAMALLNIRGVLDLALDHPALETLKFPGSIAAGLRLGRAEAHQALRTMGVVDDESDLETE